MFEYEQGLRSNPHCKLRASLQQPDTLQPARLTHCPQNVTQTLPPQQSVVSDLVPSLFWSSWLTPGLLRLQRCLGSGSCWPSPQLSAADTELGGTGPTLLSVLFCNLLTARLPGLLRARLPCVSHLSAAAVGTACPRWRQVQEDSPLHCDSGTFSSGKLLVPLHRCVAGLCVWLRVSEIGS